MDELDPEREEEPAVAIEFLRKNSVAVIAFAALVIMAAAVIYAIYAQRQWEAIQEQQGERVRLTRAELFAKSPALSPDGTSISIEFVNIGQLAALAPAVEIYERRVAGDRVIEQNHQTRQLNDVPSHGGEKSPLGTIALPNFTASEMNAIGSGSESVVLEIDAQYRDEVGDRPDYVACWKSEAKGVWNPCSPDLVDDMQSIEGPQEQ